MPGASGATYPGPLIDPRVRAVLERLHGPGRPGEQRGGGPGRGGSGFPAPDPFTSATWPRQGWRNSPTFASGMRVRHSAMSVAPSISR